MAHPKGGYKNAAGKRVPGTTTIIGRFKDSGGLLWWAFEQGRAAELRGFWDQLDKFSMLLDVTLQDMRRAIFGDIEPDPIYKLYDKRDEAASSGTLAHAYVESFILDKPREEHPDITGDEPDDTKAQAENAFQQFLKWFKQTGVEIVLTEPELVSEAHQFGGSPDAIGKIDGEYVLLDWKTSNAIYGDYLIQLCAYDLLIEECLPEYTITGGYYICRFSKDYGDFEVRHFGDAPNEKESFLLMRQLYENDKETKKRVK